MQTGREHPSIPAWTQDQLDSPIPPQTEAPYFDNVLEAWVLSRYSDVLAAFRSSELSPSSPNSKTFEPPDESVLLKMRAETQDALSPPKLNEWRDRLTPEAIALLATLPTESPDQSIAQSVDLIAAYARPLCLRLAAIVTGIPLDRAHQLEPKAHQVSAAAADPYDQALHSTAKTIDEELRTCFHSGPESLRGSTFVALSQTMPAILGNAWFALLEHPQQWTLLHRQPELLDQAIEELLRYAGLVRILFRTATTDVNLNGCYIRRGERLVFRIIAANRDPERFEDPHQVQIGRRAAGHLALGAGPHSCVGASLIRMAAVTITAPLLEKFSSATLTQPVTWQGGAGFRLPSSLWVRLE
jgi:cytochrome P450